MIKQIMKLKKGDTIGIFSPSVPITAFCPKRFNRGKDFLEAKGFNILEGRLTGKVDYYRSGTIKERAEELNELIRNKDVRCIMSTIGGMNSNSLLPYIDYEAYMNDPKPIIGYSDVTAILLGIYAKTGINTYYGPALVASFGELSPYVDETYSYFEDILVKDTILPYEYSKPDFWTDEYIDWEEQDRGKSRNVNQWITLKDGKATGRLIGGNLNTMQGIWGSEYMPKVKKGDILLIEDSLKDISTVERSFSLLKVNGIFDQVAGVILGKHEIFDDKKSGRRPSDVLMEVMGKADIPVLAEFDCAHTHPMMTMPIGADIELDATNQRVRLIN